MAGQGMLLGISLLFACSVRAGDVKRHAQMLTAALQALSVTAAPARLWQFAHHSESAGSWYIPASSFCECICSNSRSQDHGLSPCNNRTVARRLLPLTGAEPQQPLHRSLPALVQLVGHQCLLEGRQRSDFSSLHGCRLMKVQRSCPCHVWCSRRHCQLKAGRLSVQKTFFCPFKASTFKCLIVPT